MRNQKRNPFKNMADGHNKMPNQLTKLPYLSHTAYRLLTYLMAWPIPDKSYIQITAGTGLSDGAITRAITKLVSLNMIEYERGYSVKDRRATNHYTLKDTSEWIIPTVSKKVDSTAAERVNSTPAEADYKRKGKGKLNERENRENLEAGKNSSSTTGEDHNDEEGANEEEFHDTDHSVGLLTEEEAEIQERLAQETFPREDTTDEPDPKPKMGKAREFRDERCRSDAEIAKDLDDDGNNAFASRAERLIAKYHPQKTRGKL